MDIRTQILDAATRLMAQRGFEAASLKAIADEVGIRKASLLYHYSSKDELRQSVLEGLLAHWNNVLPRLLMATTLDGLARFNGVIRELIGFFSQDPDRARVLIREVLDRPVEMRAYLRRFVAPWVEVAAKYIRAGQREGRIWPDVDPEAYVMQVINLALSGMATQHEMSELLCDPPLHRTSPENAQGRGEGTSAEQARIRYVNELLRMARTSLFRKQEPGSALSSDPLKDGV